MEQSYESSLDRKNDLSLSFYLLFLYHSLDWSDESDSLSDGEDDLLDSLVILDVLVELVKSGTSHVGSLVVKEGTERVVSKNNSILFQELQTELVVLNIVLLVSVDKDEIKFIAFSNHFLHLFVCLSNNQINFV